MTDDMMNLGTMVEKTPRRRYGTVALTAGAAAVGL
jgi:hypothetical protein